MTHATKYLARPLALLLSCALAAPAHTMPAEIPQSFHGTYALTTQAGSPPPQDDLGGVVLAPGGILCVADYILTSPELSESIAGEAIWTAPDAGVQVALSNIAGDFSGIDMLNEEGAFLGQLVDTRISDDITCGSAGDVSEIIDAVEEIFELAEAAYPELFPTDEFTAPLRLLDGYIYRHYPDSGTYIGIREGAVYVMGGDFGDHIQNMGATTIVLDPVSYTHLTLPTTPYV